MIRRLALLLVLASLVFVSAPKMSATAAEPPVAQPVAAGRPLVLVCMDPLSAPLACDCVQGYAQRKYEKLGEYLSKSLHRPVRIKWSESLVTAIEDVETTQGRADLVIGKHSVVMADAAEVKRTFKPIASLTGTDGKTHQTGLIVVRQHDSAQKLDDLQGYRVFFGPSDCDEKSLAPMTLLKQSGVSLPAKPETYPACSTAAAALVELDKNVKAAAIISSYAGPLLEGCGTVKKGDLRVIGESDPVPFVTAFVSDQLSTDEQAAIKKALLDVGIHVDLLEALETLDGFVEFKELPPPGSEAAKKLRATTATAKKK
ncbi:MAG: PhnD/SsuA/transferrin family substrate-binding protein [Planctomycetaceae bacterium]